MGSEVNIGNDACESNGRSKGASWEHATEIKAMRSIDPTVIDSVSCKRLYDKNMNVVKNTMSVCKFNDFATSKNASNDIKFRCRQRGTSYSR